jgi:hypothetical protein
MATTKTKMRRIDIVNGRSGWRAETKSGNTFATGPSKQAVIQKTASKARNSTRPTSVRIHGKNGRIQEERTYR